MQNMFDEVTLHRSQTINRHTQLKCKRELCMIELKNNKYYISGNEGLMTKTV